VALRSIGAASMASFAEDQDLLRVAWRDLEAFPDLQARVRTERIRATFDEFGRWLKGQAEAGRVRAGDPPAVAAVALSALAFFQLLKFLMHDTPGGLDEDRFLQAWTELFDAALVGVAGPAN
jgi:hypothetical protein